MTMLDTPPMTQAEPEIKLRGARAVRREGREVVIEGVGLYAEMDDGGKLGKVDEAKLRKVADDTNARIARNQSVQIVVRHDTERPGDYIMPNSIGCIDEPVEVARSPVTGKLTIFGTMRIRDHAFEAYIASNDYPRRSAEIAILKRDGATRYPIGQVALLGREFPRAELEDLRQLNAAPGEMSPGDPDSTEALTMETNAMSATKKQVMQAYEALSDEDKKSVREQINDDGGSKDDKPKEEKKAENADEAKKDDKQDNATEGGGTETNASPGATEGASHGISESEFNSLRIKVAEQSIQIGNMIRANRRESLTSRLTRMNEVDGIVMDVEQEVNQLLDLPNDEARETRIKTIADNYRRTETRPGILAAGKSMADLNRDSSDRSEHFGSNDSIEKVIAEAERILDKNEANSHDEAMSKAAEKLGYGDAFKL